MLSGLGLLFANLGLLLVAMWLHSLPGLLVATALGGAAIGLGFRGSLEVVNLLAPGERRSDVLAQYYLLT